MMSSSTPSWALWKTCTSSSPLVRISTALAHFLKPAWNGSLGDNTWLNFRVYLALAIAGEYTRSKDRATTVVSTKIFRVILMIKPPSISIDMNEYS